MLTFHSWVLCMLLGGKTSYTSLRLVLRVFVSDRMWWLLCSSLQQLLLLCLKRKKLQRDESLCSTAVPRNVFKGYGSVANCNPCNSWNIEDFSANRKKCAYSMNTKTLWHLKKIFNITKRCLDLWFNLNTVGNLNTLFMKQWVFFLSLSDMHLLF